MVMGTGWTRLSTAGVAVVTSALLSGCVSTVSGTATRDPDAAPWETILNEADLDDLMVPVGKLNDTVGAFDLEVALDTDEMNDNSDAVADPNCLAAAYGAQESVYADSGWTSVRDQIVREPGENNEHWLEQVVVLYPSDREARDFLDASKSTWENCVGSLVTYDIDDAPLEWDVGEVTAEESSISQLSTPQGAPGGGCHHAMSVASNVIVETWACGDDVVDEASVIAGDIVAKIEQK